MSVATVTIAEVMNSVRCSRVMSSCPRTHIAVSSSAPLTAASVASWMSLACGGFGPSSALRSRIEDWEALALVPGRARKCPPEFLDDLDIAAFDYVGDPFAENLLLEIYAAGTEKDITQSPRTFQCPILASVTRVKGLPLAAIFAFLSTSKAHCAASGTVGQPEGCVALLPIRPTVELLLHRLIEPLERASDHVD
jgi:hypothetical protein